MQNHDRCSQIIEEKTFVSCCSGNKSTVTIEQVLLLLTIHNNAAAFLDSVSVGMYNIQMVQNCRSCGATRMWLKGGLGQTGFLTAECDIWALTTNHLQICWSACPVHLRFAPLVRASWYIAEKYKCSLQILFVQCVEQRKMHNVTVGYWDSLVAWIHKQIIDRRATVCAICASFTHATEGVLVPDIKHNLYLPIISLLICSKCCPCCGWCELHQSGIQVPSFVQDV